MAREMALGGDGVAGGAVSPRTRGWPEAESRPRESSIPFWGVMLFTFVLFVAPQNFVPPLQAFMLAKVTVGIAVIVYLAKRTVAGRRLTVMTPPVRWGLVLAALALLSIPGGFWPGGSVSVFLELFGKNLVVFLLIANVVDTPRRAKLLIGSMVAWGSMAAAVAVSDYVTAPLGANAERIAGYESPLAANPNDLALTLNILLGLALGLLPGLHRRSQRVLLVGAMALLISGIVVSFSRSGFVTLGVLGGLWAARAVRERGGWALGPIALVVAVLGVAVPVGYIDRVSTIVDADADTTGSSEERWQGMMQAVRYIGERPILGFGLGNSRHVSVARGGLNREPHNAYLKVGAELGVGGAVVYALFVASALAAACGVRRRLSRRRQHPELARLAGGVELALIAFAVGALFSPVPYHLYFYYPAGLAVALSAMAARLPATPARAPGA